MDNFNATSTNSTASVNTTTAAHMQLERGTGRPDIWLAAGYLTVSLVSTENAEAKISQCIQITDSKHSSWLSSF